MDCDEEKEYRHERRKSISVSGVRLGTNFAQCFEDLTSARKAEKL